MEYKTDALLLRAADYGENDKMVTLFTADRGKVSAAMKGVKKAGAKLRFAAQPFCFAEYVLAERGGRNTVISASLHDGFFALREDVNALFAASVVAESCDKLLLEGIVNAQLLVAAVSALGKICGGEGASALIRFLLDALRLAGYPVVADRCAVCGKELNGRMRFDLEGGSFSCDACGKGTPASEVTFLTIRHALGKGEALAEGEKRDGEKRALRLIYSYFAYQTDSDPRSLAEYIRML